MDPANAREALREVLLDVEEGADLVMVKPAGPYLDVIRQVRDAVRVPVVAYQVSGEYSLIKAAAARGWIDERAAVLETLTGIRRAGADLDHHLLRAGGGAVAARRERRTSHFLAACRRQPVAHTPGLGHAPGRALPAGVPRAARQGRLRDPDAHPRAGRRGDPAAAAALRARCGHPLQRHHDPAAGHGRGARLRARARACASPSAPMRRSTRCPRWCPSATCRSCWRPIRLVRAGVPRGVPLIGFAGAPFTLLCYLVCGRPSKEFGAGARLPLRPAAHAPSGCSTSWPMPWRRTCAAQAARRRAGADAVRVLGGPAGAARVRAVRAAGGARAPWRRCARSACR